MAENILWLGHASFRIKAGDSLIYIDPYKIVKQPPADIILITHQHFDHCSISDIKMIKKADSVIVAPPDCAEALGEITEAMPGEDLEGGGLGVGNLDLDGALIELAGAQLAAELLARRAALGPGRLC